MLTILKQNHFSSPSTSQCDIAASFLTYEANAARISCSFGTLIAVQDNAVVWSKIYCGFEPLPDVRANEWWQRHCSIIPTFPAWGCCKQIPISYLYTWYYVQKHNEQMTQILGSSVGWSNCLWISGMKYLSCTISRGEIVQKKIQFLSSVVYFKHISQVKFIQSTKKYTLMFSL